MRQSKRFTALALALALVLSLTTGASAAQPKAEQVAASINYDITVEFNGEAKALSNVNGQQVYPVLYGGPDCAAGQARRRPDGGHQDGQA